MRTNDTEIVVLDTETTGLSFQEDRVVEIGCIKMQGRKPIKTFHTYLNADKKSSQDALRVHGLTEAFLADKPRFTEVMHDFLAFVDRSVLVIHNAPFDMGFLQAELVRAGQSVRLDSVCDVVDSLVMARKMFPGQKNTLDALCNRFGIDIRHRSLHGALKDADLLMKVYVQMTTLQHNLKWSETDGVNSCTQQDVFLWKEPTSCVLASACELEDHKKFMKQLQEAD